MVQIWIVKNKKNLYTIRKKGIFYDCKKELCANASLHCYCTTVLIVFVKSPNSLFTKLSVGFGLISHTNLSSVESCRHNGTQLCIQHSEISTVISYIINIYYFSFLYLFVFLFANPSFFWSRLVFMLTFKTGRRIQTIYLNI